MCSEWIYWLFEKNKLNSKMRKTPDSRQKDFEDYPEISRMDLACIMNNTQSSPSTDASTPTSIASASEEYDFLSLKFPEDDLSSTNSIRILLVGERGVGKTALANALRSLAKGEPNNAFNENEYFPTRRVTDETIASATGFDLKQRPLIDYIRKYKYSESFVSFALNPQGKARIIVIDTDKLSENRVKKNRVFDEMRISEYPPGSKELTETLAKQFNKIIIMADYTDICSMRSVQHWATILRAPANKTIVCVNKCDVEAASSIEDFRSRKAYVMDHYSSQCNVEYISVKTGANVGFIYKYL